MNELLAHIVPFFLVLTRLAGLFLLAPMLTSIMIPMKFKALMLLMFSIGIYPLLPAHAMPSEDVNLVGLLGLCLVETMIGFSIGLLASVPLTALEMSGVLMSQQMGMGLGRVYNPELDIEADVLGQFLFFIASGAFFGVGGLEALCRATADSFQHVPIGGLSLVQAPLDLLVGVLQSSFELTLRVAAPITGIVFLLVILLGAISKTMPQLSIMSVGFTIKILAGIAILIGSVYAIHHAIDEHVESVMHVVVDWCSSVRAENH